MGTEHEMVMRFPSATPQADQVANAVDIANSLKTAMLTSDSFLGVRHADSGSNLSFPLAFTPIAGTGSWTPETDDEAKFWSITGRSLGGYRCRLTFFTGASGDSAGYRIIGSNNLLTAVGTAEPPLVAIDGQEVVWNNYMNIGYNSYWQRQLRG